MIRRLSRIPADSGSRRAHRGDAHHVRAQEGTSAVGPGPRACLHLREPVPDGVGAGGRTRTKVRETHRRLPGSGLDRLVGELDPLRHPARSLAYR